MFRDDEIMILGKRVDEKFIEIFYSAIKLHQVFIKFF